MDPTLRKELKTRVLDMSYQMNLDKIIMSSYVRQATESQQISATDYVYAISSLLEAPLHVSHQGEQTAATTAYNSLSKEAKEKTKVTQA